MNSKEVKDIDSSYLPFEDVVNKMKIFHSVETGEVIVLIFNPNVVGITKLKDFLTLKADHLRNVVFWWKGRNEETFKKILSIWRKEKGVKLLPCHIMDTPIETFFPKS